MDSATARGTEGVDEPRALLDFAQDAVIVRALTGEIHFWNRGAEAIYGWAAQEVVGRRIQAVLRCTPTSVEMSETSLRTHHEWSGQLAHRHKAGSEVIVDSRQVLWPAAAGRPATVLEINRDVTEAQRALERLHESEEWFRLMVEGVQEYAIFMLDPGGVVVSWNAGAERMKGYRTEEICGLHFSCLYPAEDREAGKPDEHLRMAADAGEMRDEGWRVRRDGTRFWADVVLTAVRDQTGDLRGFAKVTRDCTDRRRSEQRLQYQALLLECVSDAIVATDENFVVTAWSPGAERLYGWREDEVLGRPAGEVLQTQMAGTWRNDALQVLRTEGEWRGEVIQRHKDGSDLYIDATTRQMRDGPTHIVAVNRDIGDRKRAAIVEERNRIARDLHDCVAQALYSMTLQARAVEMALEGEEREPDDPVMVGIADVRSLTRRALAEIRTLIFELRPTSLAEEGLLLALQKQAAALTAKHGLTVNLSIPSEPAPLPTEIEENLYRLAQEALTNVAKHAGATTVDVRLAWPETTGGFIELDIADDGVGFQTGIDRPGHLGLRTMSERITTLGGTFEVSSALGMGTTVRVSVPLKQP